MTQTDEDPNPRQLGSAFATGGDEYERLRPGYPVDAVTWLIGDTPEGSRAADVGAGTGKLTTDLMARGLDVVAIDPSADMLAQLSLRVPAVDVRTGSGEHTRLSDASVDLITFAQSWHWVEPIAGAIEVARVLKPDGRVSMVWNFVDPRVDWVAELSEAWHTLSAAEAIDAERHRPRLGSDFGPVESITVDWVDTIAVEDLAALVTTRSYFLTASASEQQSIQDRVGQILRHHFFDTVTVDLPYRTHCFRAERRS